uniref:uncharacterized protein LOC120341536 n=1 Tax=Styela clava TaxID=7725 RepID=UPI0019393017|nr:uncharacterized protein LOC120341536 [Styela clava]
MRSSVGITSITFALLFTTGIALKCYVCKDCETGLSGNDVRNCTMIPGTTTRCYTTEETLTISGEKTVKRGCSHYPSNSCNEMTLHEMKLKICHCDADLCNRHTEARASTAGNSASGFIVTKRRNLVAFAMFVLHALK